MIHVLNAPGRRLKPASTRNYHLYKDRSTYVKSSKTHVTY